MMPYAVHCEAESRLMTYIIFRFSTLFFSAQSFGAGDGVAIFDGDLAVRTRASLCILHPSLREAESRLMTFIIFRFSTLFFSAQSFGAGDGVAIFDGDLAVRTRASLCILHPSLREAESRLMTFIIFRFSTLFFSAQSFGAGDGIRTRDFHLGKVTLYH